MLDIAQQLHKLGNEQFKYDAIKGRTAWKNCNYLRTTATRARYAMTVYFSEAHTPLDWINYLLFFGVLVIRMRNDSIVTDRLVSIGELSEMDDPYLNDNDHVPMYSLGFYYRIAMWMNAVNSMLTWVKMFKFLNYFPQLQILTSTMMYAALPLGWFLFVFFIIMMGMGQGFHIAFGFDVKDYQTISSSLLSLLRMAVGDFDYTELEDSHYMVGPLMFWIFIVLVYFILMSVFIALIAEAYEEAKADMVKAEEDALTQAPGGFGGKDDAASAQDAEHLLDGLTERSMVSEELVLSLRDALKERKEKVAAIDKDKDPAAGMAGGFCNQTGKPASYKFKYDASPARIEAAKAEKHARMEEDAVAKMKASVAQAKSKSRREGGGPAASGPTKLVEPPVFLEGEGGVHHSPIDIFAGFSADTIAETLKKETSSKNLLASP